jgi:hypothetical protein
MKYLFLLIAIVPIPDPPKRVLTMYEKNFVCCEACIEKGADFGFMTSEDTCTCFKKPEPKYPEGESI